MDVETCMYNTRPFDWKKLIFPCNFPSCLVIAHNFVDNMYTNFKKCSKSKSDRTLILHYWSQFSIIIDI